MSSILPTLEPVPTRQELEPSRTVDLSRSPCIWIERDFLNVEECTHFIALAKQRMAPSLTVDNKDGTMRMVESRTSRTASLEQGDATVFEIEKRITVRVAIPLENGEPFQVHHYGPAQEYRPHFDYFDDSTAGGLNAMKHGGQRRLTVILYLTDVEEGGETEFPKSQLRVRPKKGLALFFWNLYAEGHPDPGTLHAALPVVKGDKWVATKWMRQSAYV